MKSKTRVYIILGLIALAAVAACLLLLPVFHTKSIRIEDVKNNKAHTVDGIEELVKGKSIFLADRKSIKAEIEKNPYLIYKSLSYKLPDGIVIRVEERQPRYYIVHLDSFLYMTYDGIVINSQREKLGGNIPAVKGINVNSFNIGEKPDVKDEYKIMELTKVMEKMYPVGMETRIAEIDMSDIIMIKMTTTEGHEIVFGTSENAERKIEWIYAILEKLSEEGNSGKKFSVDVSVPESPTYKEITQ